MLFKSIVDEVINKSFAALLSDERESYLRQIGKCWDFYNGFQKQYITQYEGELKSEFIARKKPYFNYTKTVVDELVSGCMGHGFTINFDDPKYQKAWTEIISPFDSQGIYPMFETIQRISEISDTCAVVIRRNDKTGSISFEDIRGEYLQFIPDKDNPRKIGTIIISYIYDSGDPNPKERMIDRLEMWSDERCIVIDYNRATKTKRIIKDMDNPYGFKPIEIFQPQKDDSSFFGATNISDIVEINDIYNNLWSSLIRICDFQSFSILFIKSDEDINLEIAPTRFLKLQRTDSGDAKYITPDAKISDVLKVSERLKAELGDVSRMPSDVISSGSINQPQSGYSLRVKRIPIENQLDQRRKSYGPNLIRLAKKAIIIQQLHTTGKDYDFNAMAAEVKFGISLAELSPEEQAVIDAADLQYGIISPVDLMLRKFPELTREKAIERILENKREMEDLGFSSKEGMEYDDFMSLVNSDINPDKKTEVKTDKKED